MLRKLILGIDDRMRLVAVVKSREPALLFDEREDVLAVVFGQLGLVIKEIDLSRATGLKEVDHPLRLGRVMRPRQEARLIG